MRKVVINDCFGGFSLSKAAVKWIAEKNGQECFFFEVVIGVKEYRWIPDTGGNSFWVAFSIPNPNEVIGASFRDEDGTFKTYNKSYNKYALDNRYDNDRANPVLIECLETLGAEVCSGSHAKLKIIEIPDDIEYEIAEYDGSEWIAEKHRTWR